MMMPTAELRLRTDCANAIRALAMDVVQAANSGHPGMPMGMADIAEALWRCGAVALWRRHLARPRRPGLARP